MNLRLLVIGMLLLITGASYSQEMEKRDKSMSKEVEMKEKLQSKRIAFISSELDLSPQEAQSFWPIFNTYQDELDKARKENRPEKKRWEEMTDADAAMLIESKIAMEEKELSLRKKLINDLKPILPTTKIARLMLVEREFKSKMLSSIKERFHRKREIEERRIEKKNRN